MSDVTTLLRLVLVARCLPEALPQKWPPEVACAYTNVDACAFWDVRERPDTVLGLRRIDSSELLSVVDVQGERRVVGSGASATLYLCQLKVTGRYCVAKFTNPLIDAETFNREARMTSVLSPTGGIPRFHGVLYHEGVPLQAFVQDYVGNDIDHPPVVLRELIYRETANVNDKKRLLSEWLKNSISIAKVLEKFHVLEIFHGDVQMDNILVTATPGGDARFYLVDLGQAAYVNETYSYVIGHDFRQMLLTHYPQVAPELKDGGEFSKEADIFGLGFVLKAIADVFDITDLSELASKCMVQNPSERPDIKIVILMLEFLFNQ